MNEDGSNKDGRYLYFHSDKGGNPDFSRPMNKKEIVFTRWLLACTESGDVGQIAARTLITATCGLGLLSGVQAASIFQTARQIATLVKKVAVSQL
jgi:hypothetical protein